jgi:methyltransferase-like protein
MVREMMLFHTRHFSEPSQQVSQGLALIKFLAEWKQSRTCITPFLEEFERLTQRGESSLYHDELAGMNSPLYFFQFVQHAARHGLQYLSEANFFDVQKEVFPKTVVAELDKLGGNIIEQDQYLDFLKCRKFRQTLLCHQSITVDRDPKSEGLGVLYVAAPLSPTATSSNAGSDAAEEFRTPKGASITVGQPIIKAALLYLSEIWPQSVHFSDLRRVALSRLEKDRPSESEATRILGRVLFQAYAAGMIELHPHSSRWASQASERPVASPLTRLQLQSQANVTNLRHVSIQVEGTLERQLLLLLDGTRNRDALLSDLREFLESSLKTTEPNSELFNSTRHAMENLAVDLDPNLQKLARLALLIE